LIASGETGREKGNLKKKIFFVSFCMVGAAIYVLSQKVYTFYISGKGLGNLTYYNFLNFAVVFLVFISLFLFIEISAHFKRKRNDGEEDIDGSKFIISTLPLKKIWYLVAFAAIALYIDQYLSTAASTLDSAVYYPMAYGLSLLIAAMLDTFVFGTKISLKRIVAVVLVIASMLLVNL
jgi:drug/metabolite transporter (DMT)-like permease